MLRQVQASAAELKAPSLAGSGLVPLTYPRKYSARQQKIAIAQLRSWPENYNLNEIALFAVLTHAIICIKITFSENIRRAGTLKTGA